MASPRASPKSCSWAVCQHVVVRNQPGRKKPDARTIMQQYLLNQDAK